MAESQLKQRQKPFWLKRVFQLAFWPIGALFQWLAQPVHVHETKVMKRLGRVLGLKTAR